MLEEDEVAQIEPLLGEELDDLLGAGAVVLELAACRRAAAESESASTSVREPAAPAWPASTPEVGEREHVLLLLLRAHDPLQRRVARLVDRVRDGDDRRQRRPDDVVAELGLTLPGDGPSPASARRPARSAAAAAARRPRPRAPHRRSRRPAGRRGRGRRPPAPAPWRARSSSRRGRSRAASGSETRTARSAPIASALRSESSAFSGPSETSTTSPPSPASASRSRSASSTAFVSTAFSAPSPERSRRFVPGSIRFVAAASGTCFTQTAIFTGWDSNDAARGEPRESRAVPKSALQTKELSADGARLARFEREPDIVMAPRTSARGTLFLTLAALLCAGLAAASAQAGIQAAPSRESAAARLPDPRRGDLDGRLRRSARSGLARGERHAGAAPRPRPCGRARPGQVLDDLRPRRLHALSRGRERYRVSLRPSQQRPHRRERQPRQVRPRRRLRGGSRERRQGRGGRADRLRRRLGRRRRDPSAPPLRGASERGRRDEPDPASEAGEPAPLRRRARHHVHGAPSPARSWRPRARISSSPSSSPAGGPAGAS